MAWSPPADKRRIVWVSAPGDYATFNSNQTPDGTLPEPQTMMIGAAFAPPLSVEAEQILCPAGIPIFVTI
jgi:hypothetical protein